jgi:hypothetical protein
MEKRPGVKLAMGHDVRMKHDDQDAEFEKF